ncbi:MAG: hypothetical protein ABSC51_00670 [Gaiellaceae bacterium]
MSAATTATQAEIEGAVARLHSKDAETYAIVERLGRRMSRETFLRTVEKFERRRARGGIEDDAAYLVGVLKIRAREEDRQRAAAVTVADAAAPAIGIEKIKREEPERYLRTMLPRLPELDVSSYLLRYVNDPGERCRLLRLAEDLGAAA